MFVGEQFWGGLPGRPALERVQGARHFWCFCGQRPSLSIRLRIARVIPGKTPGNECECDAKTSQGVRGLVG